NILPSNVTIEDINRQCEHWTITDVLPTVPLVHGFCFGITRSVIEAIGYLDDGSFPKGYGEENDYCFRATNAGFQLVLATHTYIYHSKSKSYPDDVRKALMATSYRKLCDLHGSDRVKRSVESMNKNRLLERYR